MVYVLFFPALEQTFALPPTEPHHSLPHQSLTIHFSRQSHKRFCKEVVTCAHTHAHAHANISSGLDIPAPTCWLEHGASVLPHPVLSPAVGTHLPPTLPHPHLGFHRLLSRGRQGSLLTPSQLPALPHWTLCHLLSSVAARHASPLGCPGLSGGSSPSACPSNGHDPRELCTGESRDGIELAHMWVGTAHEEELWV